MQTCNSKMDSDSQTHTWRHTPTNLLVVVFLKKCATRSDSPLKCTGQHVTGRRDGQDDGQLSNRVRLTANVLLSDTHTHTHTLNAPPLYLSWTGLVSLPHQSIHVHTTAGEGRRCCSPTHGHWAQLSLRWYKQDMRNQSTRSPKSIWDPPNASGQILR